MTNQARDTFLHHGVQRRAWILSLRNFFTLGSMSRLLPYSANLGLYDACFENKWPFVSGKSNTPLETAIYQFKILDNLLT